MLPVSRGGEKARSLSGQTAGRPGVLLNYQEITCHNTVTSHAASRPGGGTFGVLSASAALLRRLAPAPAAEAAHSTHHSKIPPQSRITVKDDSTASFWSGTVLSNGPRIPSVPACATVACDHRQLTVRLPDSTFEHRTGGVQVAIRFTQAPFFDELGLYVYQGDHLVGSSTATVRSAE